jgi:hypothetical protein
MIEFQMRLEPKIFLKVFLERLERQLLPTLQLIPKLSSHYYLYFWETKLDSVRSHLEQAVHQISRLLTFLGNRNIY